MNDNERILSLDVIKAFAILLVVLGHLILYLSPQAKSDPVNIFIWSIHMPLFFFVSGYLSHKRLTSLHQCCRFFFKKMRLLIPFFLFGTLLSLMEHDDFAQFFAWQKYGLWYLWVLFLFFLFYDISNIVSLRLKNQYSDILILVSIGLCCVFSRNYQNTYWGGD